jgi:hypothetical protein
MFMLTESSMYNIFVSCSSNNMCMYVYIYMCVYIYIYIYIIRHLEEKTIFHGQLLKIQSIKTHIIYPYKFVIKLNLLFRYT